MTPPNKQMRKWKMMTLSFMSRLARQQYLDSVMKSSHYSIDMLTGLKKASARVAPSKYTSFEPQIHVYDVYTHMSIVISAVADKIIKKQSGLPYVTLRLSLTYLHGEVL